MKIPLHELAPPVAVTGTYTVPCPLGVFGKFRFAWHELFGLLAREALIAGVNVTLDGFALTPNESLVSPVETGIGPVWALRLSPTPVTWPVDEWDSPLLPKKP